MTATSLFVNKLVLNQEDVPQTHHTVRQISTRTHISKSSVVCIIHSDLQMKCLKEHHAQELTVANHLACLMLVERVQFTDLRREWPRAAWRSGNVVGLDQRG